MTGRTVITFGTFDVFHVGHIRVLQRAAALGDRRVVDDVFVEESLELKRDYILEHEADVLVMGDDWAGKFDWVSDVCEVVYLPRTPSVSTTGIIEHIASLG